MVFIDYSAKEKKEPTISPAVQKVIDREFGSQFKKSPLKTKNDAFKTASSMMASHTNPLLAQEEKKAADYNSSAHFMAISADLGKGLSEKIMGAQFIPLHDRNETFRSQGGEFLVQANLADAIG